MCDCPINEAQTNPDGPIQWPSAELQVWGEMRSGGVAVTRAAFKLQQTNIYYGAVPLPKTKGNYEIAVVAVQTGEANAGIATRTMQI